MLKRHNQQGVASMGEYMVTFFLVIAVVVGISIYVQRALQARMRDARHHMITQMSQECDEACRQATHLKGQKILGDQYEPYYVRASSTVNTDALSHTGLLAPGIGSTGIFIGRTQSNTMTNTESIQMPPKDAADDFVLGVKP